MLHVGGVSASLGCEDSALGPHYRWLFISRAHPLDIILAGPKGMMHLSLDIILAGPTSMMHFYGGRYTTEPRESLSAT